MDPFIVKQVLWLERMIKKTKKEKEASNDQNMRISKGGKLRAYVDVLNFIRENEKRNELQ